MTADYSGIIVQVPYSFMVEHSTEMGVLLGTFPRVRIKACDIDHVVVSTDTINDECRHIYDWTMANLPRQSARQPFSLPPAAV